MLRLLLGYMRGVLVSGAGLIAFMLQVPPHGVSSTLGEWADLLHIPIPDAWRLPTPLWLPWVFWAVAFCVFVWPAISKLLAPVVPHALAPTVPPEQLPQMSAFEIADYVYNQSAWAYRNYANLNSWWMVKQFVPNEMTDAGKLDKIRYIGSLPNEIEVKPINSGYWKVGEFDESRIWDGRNEFSTAQREGMGSKNIVSLKNVRAPIVDVYRHWPKAGLPLKIRVNVCVFFRTWRVPEFSKDV